MTKRFRFACTPWLSAVHPRRRHSAPKGCQAVSARGTTMHCMAMGRRKRDRQVAMWITTTRHRLARGRFVSVARFSWRWVGRSAARSLDDCAHATVDRSRNASSWGAVSVAHSRAGGARGFHDSRVMNDRCQTAVSDRDARARVFVAGSGIVAAKSERGVPDGIAGGTPCPDDPGAQTRNAVGRLVTGRSHFCGDGPVDQFRTIACGKIR